MYNEAVVVGVADVGEPFKCHYFAYLNAPLDGDVTFAKNWLIAL